MSQQQINERLQRSIQRLIDRLIVHVRFKPDDPMQSECEALHQIAIAATETREATQTELDILRQIEDAAWMEYWDCQSP